MSYHDSEKSYFDGFPTVNFRYPGMGKSEKYKIDLMLFLVDKSGSMSSNKKLQQAKDVTDRCNLTYDNSTFYTFNTQVQNVGDKDAFKKVKPSGGTKIGDALEYIFSNAQSIGGGRSVHLVVITDAEDKMTWSKAESLRDMRETAEKQAYNYGINLSGSCLLVGGGACKAHLEYIFGRYFHHTTNDAELGSNVDHMINDNRIKNIFTKEVTVSAEDFKPVDGNAKKIKADLHELKQNEYDNNQLFPKINDDITNIKAANKNGDIAAKNHFKTKVDLTINHRLDKLRKMGLPRRIQDLDYKEFLQSEIDAKRYEKEHAKKLSGINGIYNKFKGLLTDDGTLLLDKLFEIQSELKYYHTVLSKDIHDIKNLQHNATDFAAKSCRVNNAMFPQLSNRVTCVKNKLNWLNIDKQNVSNELNEDLEQMNELCEQLIHKLDLDVASIKETFEASVKTIGPIIDLDFNEAIYALITGNECENENDTKYDINDEKISILNKHEIDSIECMNALEMSEFVFGKLDANDSDLNRYKTNFVHYDIKYEKLKNLDDDYLRDVINVASTEDRKRVLNHISHIRESIVTEPEPFQNILQTKGDFINNQRKIQSHLKTIKCLNEKLKIQIDKDDTTEQNELMNALKSQEKKIETLLDAIKSQKINDKFNALIPFVETMNKMKSINDINMKSFKQSFDRIVTVYSKKNEIDDKIKEDINNVIKQLKVMKSTKDEDLFQYKESLLNAKQMGFYKETEPYLEVINNQMNDRNKLKGMESQFLSMVDTFNSIPEYENYYRTQQRLKQYKDEIDNLKKQFAAELASCGNNTYHKLVGLMETLGNDLKYNNTVLTKIHEIIESDLSKINDKDDKRIIDLLDQVNKYGKALSDASKTVFLNARKQLNEIQAALNKQQFDFFVLKQKANDVYNAAKNSEMDKKQEMEPKVEQQAIEQKSIDDWNKMDVGKWLESVGTPYSNYKDVFIANDICGEDVLDDSFDDEFLEKELGIKSKLKRKKLLAKINELKKNQKHDFVLINCIV
eukprot:471161_1